jgi:hypothetical protein
MSMHVFSPGINRKAVISVAWVFVVLNYLYADVLVLLSGHSAATPEEAELVEALSSPEMFLVAAIYIELAMLMAVLSLVLKYSLNRWINVILAALQAIGATASLFVVTNAAFYIFFVVMEVVALVFIVCFAWTWVAPQKG